MTKLKIALIVWLVLVLGGLVAFVVSLQQGGSSTGKTDRLGVEQIPTENSVFIRDGAFGNGTLTVKKGTTITWQNLDGTNHTITFDDPIQKANNSQPIGYGQLFKRTFGATGTYKYHCSIHPSMTGTVIVTE